MTKTEAQQVAQMAYNEVVRVSAPTMSVDAAHETALVVWAAVMASLRNHS